MLHSNMFQHVQGRICLEFLVVKVQEGTVILHHFRVFHSLIPHHYRFSFINCSALQLFSFHFSPIKMWHWLQVNLRSGVPSSGRTDTCTAGAGTLIVEFGILSKLLRDPTYHFAARRANRALWTRRHNTTGLLGAWANAPLKTGLPDQGVPRKRGFPTWGQIH